MAETITRLQGLGLVPEPQLVDLINQARTGFAYKINLLLCDSRVKSRLKRYCRFMLQPYRGQWGDGNDEDLYNVVCIRVFKKISKLREVTHEKQFYGWLRRIVFNTTKSGWRNYLARHKMKSGEIAQMDDKPVDEHFEIADPSPDLETAYLDAETEKNLLEFIPTLPTELREILQMWLYENLSMREIGRRTESNHTQVHKEIKRFYEMYKERYLSGPRKSRKKGAGNKD